MMDIAIGLPYSEIYGSSSDRLVDGKDSKTRFSVSRGMCGTRGGVRYNIYNIQNLKIY